MSHVFATVEAAPGSLAAERTRYTAVAIAFHWVIAALILTNLFLGFRMGFLRGLEKFNVFQMHKSVGITILLLSLLRLAWRLANPPPEASAPAPHWEKLASRLVHLSFYGAMILMPLSGWIIVSTSKLNLPTLLYHLVPWPHFPIVHTLPAGPKVVVNQISAGTHVVLAWGMLGLLALHVGAVVKHQFIDRHPVLGRMLPWGVRPPTATRG